MSEGAVDAELVTAAATVGRARPIHGELWLCESGLLYRRLTVWRTVRQLRKERGRRAPPQTVDPADRPRAQFAEADVEAIAAEAPANRWVPCDAMRSARLRRRLTVTRLVVHLADGETLWLSWPRRDQATPAVEDRLRRWLGDALDSG